MKLNLNNSPRTFKLLGIGHRGVGKTVFLAGSYAELLSTQKRKRSQDVWFECQDGPTRRNMEKLLGYITQTGQYPPATMKVTNFSFSAKSQSFWGNKTLCHFHWWDIPGEFCNMDDPDFQAMLLHSHGCCLFIDSDALAIDKTYLQKHVTMIKQVEAIASLTNQKGLKYPFALILTKCDVLEAGPLKLLRIEENLQPLLTRLDNINAIYRRFYSGIPIESVGDSYRLYPKGASIPIRWLISEFRQLNRGQSHQSLGNGISQTLYSSPHKPYKKKTRLSGSSDLVGKNILILGLASVAVLGILTSILFSLWPLITTKGSTQNIENERTQTLGQQIQSYEEVLEREPGNSEALRSLVNLHSDLGQFNQAIPLMERLLQQQPKNLDLYFELAGLYTLTDQRTKEETVYDQILKQDSDNLIALTSKARLRMEQGDNKTAKLLFEKAEKNAATKELKAEVRKIANEALQESPNSNQP